MTPRLELHDIRKRYPGVMANDGISLCVMPGEIHAVLGENGAGKSTLMKVIYGATHADEGRILCDGEVIRTHNPAVSRALGIAMVYQHFALFESVTVVENIALSLGSGFDLDAIAARISEVSRRYGLPIEPRRFVHTLSVGERQRVEIVRCLLQTPRLLILDEPTSVLTPQAVPRLFETLRQLAAEGCSVLYISHKLHEVQELCDVATVLRNGRVAGTVAPKTASTADIARLMVGAELPRTRLEPSRRAAGPALEVRNLSAAPRDRFGTTIRDASFEVFGGEVVGIAGISGNGQAELAGLLSGERTLADAPGAIRMFGEPVAHLDAGRRRLRGLAFVPEERLGRGAVPSHPLGENAILTAHRRGMIRRGLIDRRCARRYAEDVIAGFDVRTRGPESPAQSLSGGNLQKYIVGREISLDPRILLVAQPTWGVDVGAAAYIRQALIDLSRKGAAILAISEELDELFEICDRIVVMCEGAISRSLPREHTSYEEVGLLMTRVEA